MTFTPLTLVDALSRGMAVAVALLLTYALHALLWAGAAAACVRLCQQASPATRHSIWKLALFGPLATSALSGTFEPNFSHGRGDGASARELTLPTVARSSGSAFGTPALTSSHVRWLAFGVGGAASAGLLRFSVLALLFARRLRGRRPVEDPRLLRRLARLRARTSLTHVVLTNSDALRGPVIVGGSEICVPLTALVSLGDAEVDAVFAHELAHLERRDGLWFPCIGVVQSLFWLQPVNHWLATRARESAELACDDRAVELTGDALGLARALTCLAENALRGPEPLLVPSMARSRSTLLERVRRLTVEAAPRPRRLQRTAVLGFTAIGIASASLNVRVTAAHGATHASITRTAASSPEPAPAPRIDASSAHAPPDAVAASQQITELARRALELQQRLLSATRQAQAQGADPETAPRVLELRQELRHAHEHAAWLEQRFMTEQMEWDGRQQAHH